MDKVITIEDVELMLLTYFNHRVNKGLSSLDSVSLINDDWFTINLVGKHKNKTIEIIDHIVSKNDPVVTEPIKGEKWRGVFKQLVDRLEKSMNEKA